MGEELAATRRLYHTILYHSWAWRVEGSVIPFARGRTLSFERILEKGEGIRVLRKLSPSFTGRLQGTLIVDGKERSIVILLRDGRIEAFSIDSEKTSIEELKRVLEEASDGFIEVQALEPLGVELDKEYNKQFVLEEPVELSKLLEEEAKPAPVEAPEATPITAGEAVEAGGVEAARTAPAPAPVPAREAEAVESVEAGAAGEAEAVAGGEARGTVEAPRPEARVVEESLAQVNHEAAEKTMPISRLDVERDLVAREETIPVTGAGSLQEVLEKLEHLVIPEVVDKCSSMLSEKIIDAYLVFVRHENLVKRIKPADLFSEINTLASSVKPSGEYIRVVVYLGEEKPSYDLVLLLLGGRIVASVIWKHSNPLDIIAKGMEVFREPPRQVIGARVLGSIAYLVPAQQLEQVLACKPVLSEAESRLKAPPKPEKAREKRKGLLARLFGR